MLLHHISKSLIGFLLNSRVLDKVIFQNINFSVRCGSSLLLQGKNGCGKSSLISLISGLKGESLDFGNIIWNRKLLRTKYDFELYKSRINYINEKDILIDYLRVKENIIFGGKFYQNNIKYLYYTLLKFKLNKLQKKSGTELSLGQRRRVTLTSLLLESAPLWLLDEPTIGLDLNSLKILEKLIKSHIDSSGILILASHYNIKLKSNLISLLL